MQSRNDARGKKKGRRRMQHIDNITNWTGASLEENIRMADDRTGWRKISYAAGAANIRTDGVV